MKRIKGGLLKNLERTIRYVQDQMNEIEKELNLTLDKMNKKKKELDDMIQNPKYQTFSEYLDEEFEKGNLIYRIDELKEKELEIRNRLNKYEKMYSLFYNCYYF